MVGATDAPGSQNAWYWPFGSKDAATPRECHDNNDCAKGQCCDTVTRVCVRRGTKDAQCAPEEEGDADNDPSTSSVYPARWEKMPGEAGFNAYVHELLLKARIPRTMACAADSGDRWYQRVLQFLVHPETPIERLLVAWQLGAGKTIGMIRVLDNFFDDPRPKLLLFPTDAVANNFYGNLGMVPNRYQAHLQTHGVVWPVDPPSAFALSDSQRQDLADRRAKFIQEAREFLHRWPRRIANNPYSGLAAPLRAFSYSQAAGAKFADDTLVNWPANLKGQRIRGDKRYLMSNMIVLCDEAHNLLQSQMQSGDVVAETRRRLLYATDSVVVFFTATPVLSGPNAMADATELLNLVRGEDAKKGTEGYISWFMDRPPELFASITPRPHSLKDIPLFQKLPGLDAVKPGYEAMLPTVHPVRIDLSRHGELWNAYLVARGWQQGTTPPTSMRC